MCLRSSVDRVPGLLWLRINGREAPIERLYSKSQPAFTIQSVFSVPRSPEAAPHQCSQSNPLPQQLTLGLATARPLFATSWRRQYLGKAGQATQGGRQRVLIHSSAPVIKGLECRLRLQWEDDLEWRLWNRKTGVSSILRRQSREDVFVWVPFWPNKARINSCEWCKLYTSVIEKKKYKIL